MVSFMESAISCRYWYCKANEAIVDVNNIISSKLRNGFLFNNSLTFLDIVAYRFLLEEVLQKCDAVNN